MSINKPLLPLEVPGMGMGHLNRRHAAGTPPTLLGTGAQLHAAVLRAYAPDSGSRSSSTGLLSLPLDPTRLHIYMSHVK